MMLGKMKLDKDGNLEVVEMKCAKGDELNAIRKMVKMAKEGPETCLAKDIVRRMRESRAHEGDCAEVPSKCNLIAQRRKRSRLHG